MITKRNSYDEEIPFRCETCGEEFTVEGYIEDVGNGELRVIHASDGTVLCPNDHEWIITYRSNRQVVPSHDVSYTGGTS